ncbi:MAG: hypothetical protein V3T07_02360, partial [Myxococcota bacterium]
MHDRLLIRWSSRPMLAPSPAPVNAPTLDPAVFSGSARGPDVLECGRLTRESLRVRLHDFLDHH